MNAPVRRFGGAPVLLLVVAPAALLSAGPAGEARGGPAPPPVEAPAFTAAPAPVPFGPGEEATYQLKVGVISAGTARLAVAGLENVRGRSSYRLEMNMEGRFLLLARIDDAYWSWMDTETLASRRFIRDVHQIRYRSRREFEIYPEEERWERRDNDERGATLSPLPLDDLSFIYFVRTLPLRVGEEYRFNRYYKDDGNPVVIRVLRRERVTVPAGTFETLVVQPIIKTSGLFSEGGKAEIYFSDDEHRHVVYLSTQIPKLGVGSITMHLTGVQEGTRLAASPRGGSAPPSRPPGR